MLTRAQIAERRRWADALCGSKKATGMLYRPGPDGGHCCLGVLCALQGVSDEQMNECGMPIVVGVSYQDLTGGAL